MNERIAKLIEECTDRHFSEGVGFETFDKEKFAELIVRECSEIATRLSVQYTNKDEEFYYGHRHASERVARDIKDYFGVDKFVPLSPEEAELYFGKAEE